MGKLIDAIASGFAQFGLRDAIDILIIAFLIYQLLMITKGTRATQVFKGLGVLLVASWVSGLLKLQSTAWLLDQMLKAGALAVIVLFQPELRRALEQIGRGKIFGRSALLTKVEIDAEKVIDELCIAASNLSARRVGALIIIEKSTGLADILSTGTKIEGIVSAALIENIFEPNTPLHDGAVIIRAGIVIGAGCFLPLSDNSGISRDLGTRHRAAMGVSEVSDCVAIIVSEETGSISYAHEGQLVRDLNAVQFRNMLNETYNQAGDKEVAKLLKRKKKAESNE